MGALRNAQGTCVFFMISVFYVLIVLLENFLPLPKI